MLFTKINFRHLVIMVVLALLVAGFLHFQSPNIPDRDSLFYIRSAWLLRTNSLFDTQFPWTHFSSIGSLGSDLWYGGNFLLVPFTYFDNLFLGVKLAGTIITALLLIGFFWIMQRHNMGLKFFWPFFMLFAVPNALYQFLMLRPQTISFLFSLALFSLLALGNWLGVFLAGAGLVFFHLNYFWIIILIAGVFSGFYFIRHLIINFYFKDSAFLEKEKFDWSKVLAVIAGGIMGWFLRPHPISAVKLLYIQVIKLLVEKQSKLPLAFGTEWLPYSWRALFNASSLFFLLWAAAIIFLAWSLYKYKDQILKFSFEKSFLLWGSLIISSAFFFMTVLIARKSLLSWVTFGALFIACLYSYIVPVKFKQNFSAILFIAFLFMFLNSSYKTGISMLNSIPPDAYRESALWLKENSRPGDIVFNTHWDDFSILFFWNQKNYYIGGLDPIFQYDYDPGLYWEYHFLSKGITDEFTCNDKNCSPEGRKETYKALMEDFNAKYIFIEQRRNPDLYSLLESDPRFKKEFLSKDNRETIFSIDGYHL